MFTLKEWQQKFVDKFVESNNQRNLLVAAGGTGKTVTSLSAAYKKLELGQCDKIIVISPVIALQEQWRYMADKNNLNMGESISQLVLPNRKKLISLTYQFLFRDNNLLELLEVVSKGGALLILDEADYYQSKAVEICNQVLDKEKSNQCLFISRTPLIGENIDWTHDFGSEFLFQPKIIELPETQIQLAKYSPSLCILQKFQERSYNLDDLNWRQFEKLISQLLESDGYEIQLMSGTKDGGVDVVAYKDLGEAGIFKTIWQAKKYRVDRKIGISTIRELADVRNEFNASKAFIVTSSFLTAGALARIQRDKYLLGKVDREDMESWIERKFLYK